MGVGGIDGSRIVARFSVGRWLRPGTSAICSGDHNVACYELESQSS